MRHISLDLMRVTETAAISASRWVGSGNKEEADKAATDAIRERLNQMPIDGTIVIGEGKKDDSYGLFTGEKVGSGQDGQKYDIAIDPIEGTRPTVTSGPEAISTLAITRKGAMFYTDHFYAKKLAYGPKIKSKVKLDLSDPIETTIEKVASATNRKPNNIMVCILDRPRHKQEIEKLRKMGVRIKLIQDCDVSGAVATCFTDSDVDLLYGIGGAPEAVISAAAIKCLQGDFQSQLIQKEGDKWKVVKKALGIEELVKGECIFVATGITDGSILNGVRWKNNRPITNSVFMRSESGTIRWLTVNHGN